jgi:hypothetical protein
VCTPRYLFHMPASIRSQEVQLEGEQDLCTHCLSTMGKSVDPLSSYSFWEQRELGKANLAGRHLAVCKLIGLQAGTGRGDRDFCSPEQTPAQVSGACWLAERKQKSLNPRKCCPPGFRSHPQQNGNLASRCGSGEASRTLRQLYHCTSITLQTLELPLHC